MKSLCLLVPKGEGEQVRKKLSELGFLKKELRIKQEGEFLLIPIYSKIKMEHDLAERDFEELPIKQKNYRDLVSLPEELKPLLPTSFDIVGNIAVLRLQDAISQYRQQIGEAILRTFKNIKTVALDCGVEGERRVRKLEIIAGIPTTQTLHKEYGINLELDLAKVYFSPRLATEHWRVAQQIQPFETIVDMFAGIGPFSIMIAKYKKPKKIYAIDINKDAIAYLEKNISRNKVQNIIPICGDAKEEISKLEKVNRIIMNLPFSSFEFFDSAVKSLQSLGIIHYYEILVPEKLEDRIKALKDIVESAGKKLEVLSFREVRTYSPRERHFGFDLRVT